jgi:chorismate mutase/prephenate dehydratase
MDNKAAYQGIEGSYGSEAARLFFGGGADLVPCDTFKDVFAAVTGGTCGSGIVPVENSITGSVVQNYDLLDAYNCFITGELILPVNHVLLGVPGAETGDINKVYSHEQGLLQCADYLAAHKGWQRIPYLNTAMAAQYVAGEGDKSLAAIASRYAGEKYGLSVLAQDISGRANNSTRFFAVEAAPAGKAPFDFSKNTAQGNKASLLFTLRHEKGSLARALVLLSDLNLTRIESRPSPNENWEYRFYVDLEGDLANLPAILAGLSAYCLTVRLLGIYQSAR